MYKIPKFTYDPYTNTLIMYGISDLIRSLQIDASQSVEIEDMGDHYGVTPMSELKSKESIIIDPLFDFLTNAKEKVKLSPNIALKSTDMDILKAEKKQYEDGNKSITPHESYAHYWAIKILKGTATANKTIFEKIIENPEEVKDAAYHYLYLFKTASLADIRSSFATDPLRRKFGNGSSSQITDPLKCKGCNGIFSSESNMTISNWFLEWMKWIGLMKYSNSIMVDDTTMMLYVIVPMHIELQQIASIISAIKKSTRIAKQDGKKREGIIFNQVIAELITHHEAYGCGDDPYREIDIYKIISGIFFTSFIKLGKPYNPIHQHDLTIPQYIHLIDRRICQRWLDAFENMSKILASCNEKTDHTDLLTKYKDFIASDQLNDFLEFAAMLSIKRFHSIVKKEKFPLQSLRLSTISTFIINMVNKMKEILDNKGFQHIAKAIKNATVNGQYMKGRGQNWNWEIHYTLPEDLKRSARKKDTFVTELTNFISAYNREAAKKSKYADLRRKCISTEDIIEIMSIIDAHDPIVVCNLLLAYSSASDPEVSDDQIDDKSSAKKENDDNGDKNGK